MRYYLYRKIEDSLNIVEDSRMQDHHSLDKAQQPASIDDMEPEAFRAYAHQVVDWIADYLSNAESYPVLARTAPGDIRRALPAQAPDDAPARRKYRPRRHAA